MRLVHFSDTHLGYSDYGRFDSESGVNRREADVYAVFEEVVDHIVRTGPDLVIHAGDLFDSIRPPNRAIAVALAQLSRVSAAGIPAVLIAGNHSTPRQRSAETIFKIFGYLPGIRAVHGGRYERVDVGDCAVHAVPHAYSEADLRESVRRLEPDGSFRYNVMTAHAATTGVRGVSWGEFKEQTLERSSLPGGFDYVALGHYHKHLRVGPNAYYCGSPERFSFNEVGQEKGFLEVELGGGGPRVRHVRTAAREMVDLGPIDCAGLGGEEVVRRLEEAASGGVDGRIVRATFDGISRSAHQALDFARIRKAMSGALHYEPRYNWAAAPGAPGHGAQIGSVRDEFEAYVGGLGLAPRESRAVLELGAAYLADAAEGGERCSCTAYGCATTGSTGRPTSRSRRG